ncbi:MAG: hypothetical protein GTN80_06410 [Nitrososphaeria archaeon]|nr:hypothetical protein [Nitrososphaeria archaeon]NIQ33259.1 hypothetical protein [Nitrososphaeria archaeon]
MTKGKSENRNLSLFFVIAIGFSWFFWVPQALVTQGLLAPSFFTDLKIAAYGPLIAGSNSARGTNKLYLVYF